MASALNRRLSVLRRTRCDRRPRGDARGGRGGRAPRAKTSREGRRTGFACSPELACSCSPIPNGTWDRGASLGATAAFRMSDTISFETASGLAVRTRTTPPPTKPVRDILAEPAYQFRTNRSHLDGSLVYHIGRRQPFHAWVLAGGGVVRRDERREDFEFAFPDPMRDGLLVTQPERTRLRVPIGSTRTMNQTVYAPTAHIGAGFEVYVFDYLSARAEYRIWTPRPFGYRTQVFVIGVNYYH